MSIETVRSIQHNQSVFYSYEETTGHFDSYQFSLTVITQVPGRQV